jgi:drug/metabolite transporter (DMT)-like permease
MSEVNGRLQVLLAALLFSTGGAALKSSAFSSIQLSGLRSAVAALVLMAWARQFPALTKATAAPAVFYAVTVTLFVAANKLTTAASAIFLQSLAPLLILPIGRLIGEPFRRRDLPVMGAMVGGLWLCVSGARQESVTAPDPAMGNLLAVACAITWTLTLLSLRILERRPEQRGAGLQVVIAGNILAALVALPFAWPFPRATAGDWGLVLYLGSCQIGLAYVFLIAAVRRLPALEVSLLLLLEPVLNPFWTWLIRSEEPGPAVIAGGALIIGATALRSLTRPQGS